MNKFLSILFTSSTLLVSGCDQGPTDQVVTIKTEFGEMVAILYDETPKHKANFIKLTNEHYFDGTLFHRVIKDFMIQGGDPDSKNIKPGQALGDGGPGYTLPAEINEKFYHEKGALAAARQSDNINPKKESSGSQFYIVQGRIVPMYELEGLRIDASQLDAGLRQMFMDPANNQLKDSLIALKRTDQDAFLAKVYSLAPRVEKVTGLKVMRENSQQKIDAYTTIGGVPHLDGGYTVFGKVIKGLEVIDKIAAQPGDGAGRPFTDIPMKVTVSEVPRSKITKLYGYKYPDSK